MYLSLSCRAHKHRDRDCQPTATAGTDTILTAERKYLLTQRQLDT